MAMTELAISLVPDSYVEKTGVITSWNGWSRTDYTPPDLRHYTWNQ